MAVAQAQVLQCSVQRQPGLGGVCAVVLGQVAAKGAGSSGRTGGACCRHHIRVNQAATLEHPLHFFAGAVDRRLSAPCFTQMRPWLSRWV